MSEARTPREAKQEFLNDLIGVLRSVVVQGQSFADFKAQNVKAITEIAERHGLTIPPKQ